MSLRRTPPSTATYPNVIGTPGGSLNNLGSKFGAGQTSAGQDGEIKTARALANLCTPGGPTVLHDLVLPIANITANIDHIIISGLEVRILDSKTWAPGFYWTFAGKTRRGFTRVDHANTRTMAMATTAISKALSGTGVRFVMRRPVLVIWPSNTKKQMSLWLFRPTSANAVTGAGFAARLHHYAGMKPANQDLVAALVPLVISVRDQRTPTPTRQVPSPIPAEAFRTVAPRGQSADLLPEPIAKSTPVVRPGTSPARENFASDDF